MQGEEMFQSDENGVYATVQASSLRRLFGYSVLFVLGVLLIYTSLTTPPAPLWMAFMIGFGAAVLWLAEKMRRATLTKIELTQTELRDTAGNILARLDDIVTVDRGAFAFKPSNGFTLTLKTPKPRAWAPGLWWRLGRRVGVGGVTSAGETKFMAEQIALRIATKDD